MESESNSTPEDTKISGGDLINKFKIQSLEEVTERSEESDLSSHYSYNINNMSNSDLNASIE